jgi:Rhodopirellula transposase DDE domain
VACVTDEDIARRFESLRPHLDEKARRLVLGAEAAVLGRGGIKRVAAATGSHPDTVARGVREVRSADPADGRVRRPGGGRRPATEADPELVAALEKLVAPQTRGDPESPLRWTTVSTRDLAATLTQQGHPVSATTVRTLLSEQLGYSLQANAKTIEGRQHPDRDAQFRHITERVREHQQAKCPVISVDTKKKELVGQFSNKGRQWRPKGEPEPTKTHDFADKQLGKAIPYGVYDVAADTGWVNVGTDHDTAEFAVESIRRWWTGIGKSSYPDADRLLICADGGGSNGYRTRQWKTELAAFAAETGLTVNVCHLPPGTSKWNKIEHRLFSHISMNWRGRPLQSHEVIVESIAATTTDTGLSVHAELDTGSYPTGIKIAKRDVATLEQSGTLERHHFHGEWNYSLHPTRSP